LPRVAHFTSLWFSYFDRVPLLVDPHGHISEEDQTRIIAQFEHVRGPHYQKGPPMYIISPMDRHGGDDDAQDNALAEADAGGGKGTGSSADLWSPSFTCDTPEWVVLKRAASLAKRSHDYLASCQEEISDQHDPSAVFRESSLSLKSYSALLRVDPDFLIDSECSSTTSDFVLRPSKEDDGAIVSSYTRSIRQRSLGPIRLRQKLYRNLKVDDELSLLVSETVYVCSIGIQRLLTPCLPRVLSESLVGDRSRSSSKRSSVDLGPTQYFSTTIWPQR
jgi:U3 small nucleolar RNA-associated protein 22